MTRKLGFCEHIASAFVVLMRAMDVPARIVTGYQGGERNSVDGYWTVRQSDAHAWAEVWQSGRGWVRVDPTSAVAPGRTGAAQRLQAPQGAMASAFTGALGTFSPTLLANAARRLGGAEQPWNQWVLNYTQSRQFDLLKALGFQFAQLGRPELRADRHRGGRQPGRGRLGDVGTHPARPLAAPAATRAPAPARRRARAARHQPAAPDGRASAATFGPAATALHDWLLRLEAQRYARDPAASLATLRREYHQLAWPN